MKKIFSPTYVFLGTFFGTPLTAIYMLYKNNAAMDIKERNKIIIVTGLLLTVGLLISFNLVIDPSKEIHTLNDITLYQFLYLLASLFIPAFLYERYTAKKQMTKKQVRESEIYSFRPFWQILLVTLAGFTVAGILDSIILFFLDNLNIIDAGL